MLRCEIHNHLCVQSEVSSRRRVLERNYCKYYHPGGCRSWRCGMMFDYYIRQLGDYDFILVYLEEQGFEGLIALVREVRELKKDVK